MNYSQIRKMDISNGEGIGVALFVSGCEFHCKNCFNQETWDYNSGERFTEEIKEKFFSLIDKPYVKRVSILGGSPLSDKNVIHIAYLLREIKRKFPDKQIWVYTGYTFEEIVNYKLSLDDLNMVDAYKCVRKFALDYIDVLVDGRYVDNLRDLSLKFRGSKNQRIIDVQKSLVENKVVER